MWHPDECRTAASTLRASCETLVDVESDLERFGERPQWLVDINPMQVTSKGCCICVCVCVFLLMILFWVVSKRSQREAEAHLVVPYPIRYTASPIPINSNQFPTLGCA